jgi:hypothetical protein
MSLQDMDDLDAVVAEAARLLEPGGRFCFAVVHPLRYAGDFASGDEDSPFVVGGSYFERRRIADVVERDGLSMTFHSVQRPLEDYARALEAAGLLVEALREPVPPDDLLRDRPRMARQARIPNYLHVRAVKPG